jgi:septal ring factor EnvC (AmiA/AmiB activator)
MSFSTALKSLPPVALAMAALLLAWAAPAAADDLKNSKKRYRAIQMQIKDQEEKLKRTIKAEDATLSALDETNRRLNKTRRELKSYRARLNKTEKEISGVTAEISALREKLERHRRWMSRKLRAMQRYGKHGDVLVALAASEDAAGLMRTWRYLEELAAYERAIIEEHRETLASLDAKEAELEALRERLASEEAEIGRAEEELARESQKKRLILASVRKKKEAYEKMLRDLNEASGKLQKMIEEQERRKRFASKGFQKMRGSLPWPVEGRVALPYGAQKDPNFHTPVFRNGIYISARAGSSARAVHGGRVEFANWFKGYGQLVIVNHGGGYHSLYANLAEIFLKEGDIIGERVDIGRVGQSSVTEAPSLYFEIRYKGKPLNPVQWLEKK